MASANIDMLQIVANGLEEKLRVKGFANDTSIGAPICRWMINSPPDGRS